MRYLTTAALALVLAAGGAAALAQPQGGDQNNGKPGQQGHPAGQHAPQGGQHAPQGGQHAPVGVHGPLQGAGGVHAQSTMVGGQRPGGGPPVAGQAGGPAGHRTFTQQPGGRPGAQGHPQGLQFRQHALRPADRGRTYYRPGAFQQHVVVTNRFHVANWSRPSGWYYRSWAYGMYLPFGWFLPQYYLNWGIYDLPPPPIGCEWVREGPDAVLVDIWTGEILSVYSGVFY